MAAASNEDLREFLYAEERTADQIEEMLREQTFIRKVNTDDLLLHSLTGQYLYILIRVSGARVDSHFRLTVFVWNSHGAVLWNICRKFIRRPEGIHFLSGI